MKERDKESFSAEARKALDTEQAGVAGRMARSFRREFREPGRRLKAGAVISVSAGVAIALSAIPDLQKFSGAWHELNSQWEESLPPNYTSTLKGFRESHATFVNEQSGTIFSDIKEDVKGKAKVGIPVGLLGYVLGLASFIRDRRKSAPEHL